MNKKFFSMLGIAVLLTVILSGCLGSNTQAPAPAPAIDTTPGDAMSPPTPDELAQDASGTSGVSESELNELDTLADGIDSGTAEVQESNI